jgi:hypothetical protein
MISAVRDCTRTIKPATHLTADCFELSFRNYAGFWRYLVDICRSGLYPHNQIQRPTLRRTVLNCRSGITPDSGDICCLPFGTIPAQSTPVTRLATDWLQLSFRNYTGFWRHLVDISRLGLYPHNQTQRPALQRTVLIVVPELHRIWRHLMPAVRDYTRTTKSSDPPCDGLVSIVVPELHRILETPVDDFRPGLYPHNQFSTPPSSGLTLPVVPELHRILDATSQ